MSGGGNAADGELRRKIDEYKAREHVYLAGLLAQEKETAQLRQMAADVLSSYGDVSKAAVRGALCFPTANMEVLMLRQKLQEKDKSITQLKEELEANRFDQHLPDGQALMKKCKALLTENRELGAEIREERIAELGSALQAEQRQNGQLYQKVHEAADFCKELSEENEKLQGTIARVAGKLRESRSELEVLVKDRAEAKKKRKLERDAKLAKAAAAGAAGGVPGEVEGEAPPGPCASPIATLGAFASPVPVAPAPLASPVVASGACASPVQMTTPMASPLPTPLPSPVQHQVFVPQFVAPEEGGQKVKEKKSKDKKEKSKKRKAERALGAEDAEVAVDA